MVAHIECWLGSLVIFRGIRTSIQRNPTFFMNFQGGWSKPLAPLWICAWCVSTSKTTLAAFLFISVRYDSDSKLFAYWDKLHAFGCLLIFFQNLFFPKKCLGIQSEYQTVLILIRPDVLSGMIRVHTVCNGYQQSRQRVKAKSDIIWPVQSR